LDFRTAVFVLLALLLLALLLWAHAWFWSRRFAIPLSYSLEERLRTADGADIELRRLPAPDAPAQLPPVLLVHGVGANHRNNDLSEDLSLARHLSLRGRDVWLLTLRSGISRAWWKRGRHVRFRAMVEHDLPLATKEVLSRSGASELDYVGFSMGGMLFYAAIGRTLVPESIRRVAIIGAPAIVRSPLGLRVPGFVASLPEFLYPRLRLRLAARMGAFAVDFWHSPAHRWVMNPENVAPGVAKASLVNVIEDIPGALNRDFAAWAATADGSLTVDGEPVVERLRDLTMPALFFAGTADRLAPPESVRAAFDAWGSNAGHVEKRFVVLGRAHGASADYGHGDLAVGARVREELFEPLGEFLACHAPVASA
jgi:poly[(R)-3-hydroxyalkanoate] polymerase subunit PhaC